MTSWPNYQAFLNEFSSRFLNSFRFYRRIFAYFIFETRNMTSSSVVYSLSSPEGLQAILEVSSWSMVVIGAVTLVATLFITAPYGKFSKPTGWGVRLPARLTWMLMESPNIWIPFLLLLILPANVVQHSTFQWHNVYDMKNHPNTVLLLMFLSHYIHRSLIFPMFLAQGNPMPISVMFMAFGFCSWNGFNQAVSLLFVNQQDPIIFWSQQRTFVGISLFFIGMLINMTADYSLIAQKKIAQKKNVQYIIPTGTVFNFISCPNYCM